MCGGVDPRPLLRMWAGIFVCIALAVLAWSLRSGVR
jgi:hypothetical protein